MVVSARKLLQYFQLTDKKFRDISSYVYNFFSVFQNNYVSIALFLTESLTVFCGTLRFRDTLFRKLQGVSNMTGTICV